MHLTEGSMVLFNERCKLSNLNFQSLRMIFIENDKFEGLKMKFTLTKTAILLKFKIYKYIGIYIE